MARWLITAGGVQITVKTRSDEARALIQMALSAMKPELVKKSVGIKLSVNYQDGDWYLKDHSNGIARKLNLTGDLIYHLTDRIIFHIADRAQHVHCVHAAAVAKNGCAIMVPANSGAGKSTFVTWLVYNGFDYLTDELILIDADRQIQGIARPIQIKTHGLSAIKPLLVKPKLVQKGKFANALLLDAIDAKVSEQQKHRLSSIVFPQYRKSETFSFSKLSSAQAGMSLMSNHVNARNLAGHGFRDMMAIIRNTPCYALTYGGFEALPNDFSSQLSSLLN